MYKGTSQNSQSRLFRRVYGDTTVAAGREEKITTGEKLQNLKRALSEVDALIVKLPKGSRSRREAGLRKIKLATEMAEIRRLERGDKRPVDWNRIYVLYREKAAEILGQEIDIRIFEEAKDEYVASCGLTRDDFCLG